MASLISGFFILRCVKMQVSPGFFTGFAWNLFTNLHCLLHVKILSSPSNELLGVLYWEGIANSPHNQMTTPLQRKRKTPITGDSKLRRP